MESRPEGMERWGLKEIVKESRRLVRMHRHLFMPFYLAFCLSGSLLSSFLLMFVRSTAPSPSPASDFFSTNDQGGQQVPTFDITVITTTISYIVLPILSALGFGGVTYIVAYIYSNDDDDTNVINKVFKLLPHALLRSFVTALWTWLLLTLVFIAHFLLGLLLYTITSYYLVLAMIPSFISTLFLSFLFVFSQVIAVLEPAHYGRDALHRSAKMVKVGGAGTILAVNLVASFFFVLVMDPTSQIWTVQPGWSMYLIGVLNAVCISILNFYIYVVSVVMYFVYTSRLDAAASSLPKFAASASMDHPYKPLLAAETPPVGEP